MPLETQHARLDTEGAELLGRVSSWWEQYQRLTLGALGVIVAVGLGGFLYFKSRATQENDASGQLAEASVLFWQDDYGRSLDIAKRVYTQFLDAERSRRAPYRGRRRVLERGFQDGGRRVPPLSRQGQAGHPQRRRATQPGVCARERRTTARSGRSSTRAWCHAPIVLRPRSSWWRPRAANAPRGGLRMRSACSNGSTRNSVTAVSAQSARIQLAELRTAAR